MKSEKLLTNLPAIALAQPIEEMYYRVPFYNVEIKAESKIYVKYKYDPKTQTLVCRTAPSDGLMSNIRWSYKGVKHKEDLPVTLKNDPRHKGFLADTEGVLAITNEYGSDSIYVTCEYRNMT